MFPLHLLINKKKTLSGYQLFTTRARVSAQHILERQSRKLAFEIKGKAIYNNFLGLTKIFVATGIITNSFTIKLRSYQQSWEAGSAQKK